MKEIQGNYFLLIEGVRSGYVIESISVLCLDDLITNNNIIQTK